MLSRLSTDQTNHLEVNNYLHFPMKTLHHFPESSFLIFYTIHQPFAHFFSSHLRTKKLQFIHKFCSQQYIYWSLKSFISFFPLLAVLCNANKYTVKLFLLYCYRSRILHSEVEGWKIISTVVHSSPITGNGYGRKELHSFSIYNFLPWVRSMSVDFLSFPYLALLKINALT